MVASSALGSLKVSSSISTAATSSSAFMLRLIFPSLMPITFTFTVCPSFSTRAGMLNALLGDLGNMYQTGEAVAQIYESAVGHK